MDERGVLHVRPVLVRIAVAFLQGVLLWGLYDSFEKGLWPADRRGGFVALVAAVVLVPIAHYLVADLARLRRQWPVLVATAALALGLGWHHGAWTASDPYFDNFPSFPAALVVLMFHALPFAQATLLRGVARPRYPDLFQFAWRNALLIALGGLFTGVLWLLLILWGGLFRMLGIDVFSDLFESSPFAIPATAVAVGAGIQLAGSVERLQTALRQQLLAMLKWLAPLAFLILALFAVALLAKSPELFSEHRRVISAALILWLVAMTVALLNAAYQDGTEDAPYPRWLGLPIRYVTILLLPVALLALYAIVLRIDAYGLTVPRTWGVLVALIAVAYGGGYAWAALRRGPWMAQVGTVNVAVALFTIVALTVMLSPALSPERLAAASQYERILTKADTDAYAYLRFDSGRYGRERLARLAGLEGHPQAEEIRRLASREISKKYRWNGGQLGMTLTAEAFEAFPTGSEIDPALIAALESSDDSQVLASCLTHEPCPLLFVDLNRDGTAEAMVFADVYGIAAMRKGKGWQRLDLMESMGKSHAWTNAESARRALREGRFRIVDFPWQAIEIDGDQFLFAEPPPPPPNTRTPCDEKPGSVSDAPTKEPEAP